MASHLGPLGSKDWRQLRKGILFSEELSLGFLTLTFKSL